MGVKILRQELSVGYLPSRADRLPRPVAQQPKAQRVEIRTKISELVEVQVGLEACLQLLPLTEQLDGYITLAELQAQRGEHHNLKDLLQKIEAIILKLPLSVREARFSAYERLAKLYEQLGQLEKAEWTLLRQKRAKFYIPKAAYYPGGVVRIDPHQDILDRARDLLGQVEGAQSAFAPELLSKENLTLFLADYCSGWINLKQATALVNLARVAEIPRLEAAMAEVALSSEAKCLIHLGWLERGHYSRTKVLEELSRLKGRAKLRQGAFKMALTRALTYSPVFNSFFSPNGYVPQDADQFTAFNQSVKRGSLLQLQDLPGNLKRDASTILGLPPRMHGWYLAPLKAGDHGRTYGRSFFSGPDVFKGVGGNHIFWDEEQALGVWYGLKAGRFEGGVLDVEIDTELSVELRQSFRAVLRLNEQLERVARWFKIKNDVFFTPEIKLEPWLIPVIVREQTEAVARVLKEAQAQPTANPLVFLAEKEPVFEHFGLDSECWLITYSAACGLRTEELDDSPEALAPFLNYYKFKRLSGSREPNLEIMTGQVNYEVGKLLLLGAAVPRMVFAAAAMHRLDLVGDSMFSEHNSNLLGLFDTDTIVALQEASYDYGLENDWRRAQHIATHNFPKLLKLPPRFARGLFKLSRDLLADQTGTIDRVRNLLEEFNIYQPMLACGWPAL